MFSPLIHCSVWSLDSHEVPFALDGKAGGCFVVFLELIVNRQEGEFEATGAVTRKTPKQEFSAALALKC